VPAGQHTLVLSNEGADWLQVTGYRVTGYVTAAKPFGEVLGLMDGREALLWVRNTRHWWLPVARGEAVPALPPVVVSLPSLPAGSYAVERWNTVTGDIEARLPLNGPVEVTLPPVATDVALRIRPTRE
jgi:hypothetical protein